MARPKAVKRGSKGLDEQIANLEASLGASGVKAARQIVENHTREEIALAFKTAPKPAAGGFAGRVDRLLALTNLDETLMKRMRTQLLNAAD